MRVMRLSIGLVVIGLLVAACGGGNAVPTAAQAPAATARPTTAAIATTAPVPTATAVSVPTGSIKLAFSVILNYGLTPGFPWVKSHLDPMFDPVIALDKKGQMSSQGGLVREWRLSDDGLRWTLKTRDGVVFHNGDKATAHDVKYTMDFQVGKESNPVATRAQLLLRTYDKTEVIDDSTVVAHSKSPYLFYLEDHITLSYGPSNGYLLPKKYMETVTPKEANKKPIGSGPFRYKDDLVNQEVTMEAVPERPHWYYGTPRFKTAQVVVIPEDSTRLALLKTGATDVTEILRSAAPEVRRLGFDVAVNANEKIARLSLDEQYRESFPDFGKNPMADPRVRKALEMTIDRDLIVKTYLGGLATASVYGSTRDMAYRALPIPKPDIAGAKRLLAEAGYPNGFTLQLHMQSAQPGLAESQDIMEALATFFEQAGVKVVRRPVDTTVFYQARPRTESYGVPSILGIAWGASVTHLAGLGATARYKGFLGIHTTEDPEIEALDKAVAAAKTYPEYIKAAHALADKQMEKTTEITLFYGGATYGLKSGFGGDKWDFGVTSYNINSAGLFSGWPDLVR